IHAGRTEGAERAPFTIVRRAGQSAGDDDGGMDAAGRVVGTYLHGLLADDRLRAALLGALAAWRGVAPDPRWGASAPAGVRYDRLADVVAGALDLGAIGALVGLALPRR